MMTTTVLHEPLDDAQFTLGMTSVTPSLRSYARSLSGDRELALDLTQDTLMRAWAARARFIPGSSMKAWLFRILRNVFLSHLRRRRSARTETFGDDMPDMPDMPVLPSQEDSVAVREIATAWHSLSPDHRAALQLIGVEGLSYETAAGIEQISVGTLKSRVSRARAALRHNVEAGAMRTSDHTGASAGPDAARIEEIDRKQIALLRRWAGGAGKDRARA